MLPVVIVSLLTLGLQMDDTACIATKPVNAPMEGAVTVLVVDPHGLGIVDGRITLQDKERAFTLESGRPRTIPYGAYNVSVRAGFGVRDRSLVVDRPEVTMRIPVFGDLRIECGAAAEHYVSGAVTGLREAREIWAKLVQVAGNVSSEAKLSPRGYFLFDHLANGRYILLLLDGANVVHTEMVDVPLRPGASVDLKISL